ncbi:MAG TPA: hypothetical protein VFW78_11130 [Bacteroidia bacterium]|nr:hypothetical protein [Bacteroidia bacterium]
MKKQILLSAVTLLFLSSCSKSLSPFTQQIRDQYKLSVEELKSIQFYTSNTFVLRRGEDNLEKETGTGELKVVKDRHVEEIVIKAGTPCVIKDVVDGNRVTVSFEEGGSRYLVFGSIRNQDGYYTLQALDWVKGKGKVNYGEKTYYSSEGSKDIFLTFKLKNLEKYKSEQKVLKGKKI